MLKSATFKEIGIIAFSSSSARRKRETFAQGHFCLFYHESTSFRNVLTPKVLSTSQFLVDKNSTVLQQPPYSSVQAMYLHVIF